VLGEGQKLDLNAKYLQKRLREAESVRLHRSKHLRAVV
jgi:hypothetical protein